MIARGLEPVMPPVRHLESDERHETEDHNRDNVPDEPRQHGDHPPTGRRCRWQGIVPAPRARMVLAITFQGR